VTPLSIRKVEKGKPPPNEKKGGKTVEKRKDHPSYATGRNFAA